MRFLYILFLLTTLTFQINAQSNFWKNINENEFATQNNQRKIIPASYRAMELNFSGIKAALSAAPDRWSAQEGLLLQNIPMPDGTNLDFRVFYDPIMHPDLAAQYPDIRSYTGFCDSDPTAMLRFDVTPAGFHAMLLSAKYGTVFIDPFSIGDTLHYQSYYRSEFYKTTLKTFECGVDDEPGAPAELMGGVQERAGDCQLRTYRLALACTGEYATFHGSTTAGALAAMNTTMMRVNGVYEKEFAIRMILIANNASIIYLNASTDPYTNDNGGTMLGENQTTLDNVIGTANYDIGHVFSTGGGGVAYLNSPCTVDKAGGVTGLGSPVGDAFDIDYVAHEMGHQFGGNHTFSACSGNENSSTAVEPGSGSTIMAYAGICGNTLNIQPHSDPYFSAITLAEVAANVISGNSSTCAVVTPLSNQPPTANAGADYSIPKSTPFILTGSGTDPNGVDVLTYCWEQNNPGVISNTAPPTATQTTGPVFRSISPTTDNFRIFPKLSDIVNNTSTPWEVLPSVARTLNFRLTVRDNKEGGGCTKEDDMSVTVVNTSGPFAVTVPTNTGISWTVGTTQTVTWNVVGTNAAPINCSGVDILLSTDGGYTYPVTLLTNTSNDGTQSIVVPNNVTTTARIMVRGNGNIFFDISNNNFTIVAATAPTFNMTATNSTQTICVPAEASYALSTQTIAGFSGSVTFSTSGLPMGVIPTFSPSSVAAGAATTLTISNTTGLSGTYNFTITSTSGAISRTLDAVLVANSAPTAMATLSAPANNATNHTTLPTFTWSSVTGATSYTLELSDDAGFSSPVQYTGITGTTYTVPVDLTGGTTYYWRIMGANSCGNGTASTSFQFTTKNITCLVFTSTNVPVTIPTTAATVTSTLSVGASGTIDDIDIASLSGTHTYVQDLIIRLIGPDNTTVRLLNRPCGDYDNFNIRFDDASLLLNANIPCPPVDGNIYKPNQVLSAFNGKSITGTWTLQVQDAAANDGGALNAWGIRLCALNYVLLPVEMVFFKVKAEENKRIVLNWQTASELRNKGFEVQRRRADEVEFSAIGWVDGHGTSQRVYDYQFTDIAVEKGKYYYYRLRQVDEDGKETYTDIEVAALKATGILDVTLYPNPTSDATEVRLSGQPVGETIVQLTSIDGKLLQTITLGEKSLLVRIPTTGLAPGIYMVQVRDEQESWTRKLFVR